MGERNGWFRRALLGLACGLLGLSALMVGCDASTANGGLGQAATATIAPSATDTATATASPSATSTRTPHPTATPTHARPTPTPTPATAQVSISGTTSYAFSPSSITIKRGTKVTWTNSSNTVHTVTSDTLLFDSGNLDVGHSFSFTFSMPGTYTYHCTVHPTMTATIPVT